MPAGTALCLTRVSRCGSIEARADIATSYQMMQFVSLLLGSEIISNSWGSGCLRLGASECLYQAALVHRSGEKRPIGERGSQRGPYTSPEVIAKTARPLAQ